MSSRKPSKKAAKTAKKPVPEHMYCQCGRVGYYDGVEIDGSKDQLLCPTCEGPCRDCECPDKE